MEQASVFHVVSTKTAVGLCVQFAPCVDTVNRLRTKLPNAASGVFPERSFYARLVPDFTSLQMPLFSLEGRLANSLVPPQC